MGLNIRYEFLYCMIGYAIIPIIVPPMVHNIFALLQLLEYDRQESGRYIYYNALKKLEVCQMVILTK